MDALGTLGFVLLALHGVALLALAGAIARVRPLRGVLSLVLPPLGVVWGWELGKKPFVIAYSVTLIAFSLVVTVGALS